MVMALFLFLVYCVLFVASSGLLTPQESDVLELALDRELMEPPKCSMSGATTLLTKKYNNRRLMSEMARGASEVESCECPRYEMGSMNDSLDELRKVDHLLLETRENAKQANERLLELMNDSDSIHTHTKKEYVERQQEWLSRLREVYSRQYRKCYELVQHE